MKTLSLIRIFIFFPFCGIVIPDLAFCLTHSTYNVPFSHLLIGLCLLVLIVCSFILQYVKAKLATNE
jgi:hypothetical protein